jgi:xylulokinase
MAAHRLPGAAYGEIDDRPRKEHVVGRDLVAGIDSSTQATKVLVVDPDDGRVIASGRSAHVVSGSGGARESDPDDWWRALREALEATGRAADIAALAVGAQQHGLIVVDGEGHPLRPAILWNDTRAHLESRELITAFGGRERWADRVGSVPLPAFTVASWAWLRRHEPSVAKAARGIRLPHDLLTERLTGVAVTDRGDVSGSGWWSTADESYDEEVLRLPAVALDSGLLPEIMDWREPAGDVTARAASILGLRPGALVGVGTGDNMAAAMGLGIEPGEPVLSFGTSGTTYLVTEARPVGDPSGVVAGFADATDRFLPLSCTLNCTLAVDRFAGWVGLDREDVEGGGRAVVLPFLDGERTPDLPRAAGSVTGLRHDTTRGQLLLAAYEGAVFSLLEALRSIEQVTAPIAQDVPLLLVGGGSRGQVWLEVAGRLSGRPLHIPEADELVAFGAAAQAASLLTGERPDAIARRWETRKGRCVAPVARDDDVLARIAATRTALEPFNREVTGR